MFLKKQTLVYQLFLELLIKKGYVHEETKQLIESTIKELGFVPNQLARSLTSRSSKIIGVIVPHIGPSFYGDLLEGIEVQASAYGYKIMFCHTQDDPARELEYFSFFKQYNIDGLIIASNFSNSEKLFELKIPIITVDHVLDETIPSISSNNIKGGQLAEEKLISEGSKKILLFRGPSFLTTTIERTMGFISVLKKTNIFADIYDFDLISPEENCTAMIF